MRCCYQKSLFDCDTSWLNAIVELKSVRSRCKPLALQQNGQSYQMFIDPVEKFIEHIQVRMSIWANVCNVCFVLPQMRGDEFRFGRVRLRLFPS